MECGFRNKYGIIKNFIIDNRPDEIQYWNSIVLVFVK